MTDKERAAAWLPPDDVRGTGWRIIVNGLEAAADQYLTDAKTCDAEVNHDRIVAQFQRQAEEAKALSVRLRGHFGI